MNVSLAVPPHRGVAEQFTEHVELTGPAVRVDRQRGIIHDVKILGARSRNGRVYRGAALTRSIPLYEGSRVNVNHRTAASLAQRDYEDRIGAVRNVRVADDGLHADFHFNPKHRLAEQLMWDAEHAPENVGFSHNVVGITRQENGQTIVEEITKVHSVDLVADPATSRGLFESTAPPGSEVPTELGADSTGTMRSWDRVARQWLPLARVAESAAPANGPRNRGAHATALLEANRKLEDENTQLRSELAALRQQRSREDRQALIERLITEAQIPAALDTAHFRAQCHAAGDATVLRAVVHARAEDARLIESSGRPRSVEQQQAEHGFAETVDAAEFAASLR